MTLLRNRIFRRVSATQKLIGPYILCAQADRFWVYGEVLISDPTKLRLKDNVAGPCVFRQRAVRKMKEIVLPISRPVMQKIREGKQTLVNHECTIKYNCAVFGNYDVIRFYNADGTILYMEFKGAEYKRDSANNQYVQVKIGKYICEL